MAVPITDKQELFVNGYGTETIPQGIVVKNSLWTVMQSYGKLLIKEYYNDKVYVIKLPLFSFTISSALQNSGELYTDRFWVWYISTSKTLTLLEIEPSIDEDPIVHFVRQRWTDVSSVSIHVNELDAVRLLVLSDSLPKTLKLLKYEHVKVDDPEVTILDWSATRGDSISNFSDTELVEVAYTNASSPFSYYTESYSVPIPLNLTASQVDVSATVQVDWNVSVGSDEYVLERDTDSGFSSPLTRYVGPLISFLDSVTVADTYYYRVKARVTTISLESSWSVTATAIVSGPTPPTGLAAVNGVLLGEIDTSWDILAGADDYVLQRAKDNLFTIELTTVYTGATALFVDAVTEATTYYYRVKARNILGDSSWSPPASVVVSGPTIPTNLTAVAGSFVGEVLASWDTVVEADIYILQRDKDASFDSAIDVYTGPLVLITDTVTETAVYYYRVKSRNMLGDSGWSNVAFVSINMVSITYRKLFASMRTNRHIVKQLDATVTPFVYDEKYFGTFAAIGSGSTGLNFPNGITVDFDNSVYICDNENSRIVKLDRNLHYVAQLSTVSIGKPCAIVFDTDNQHLYFTTVRYFPIDSRDMYIGVGTCTTSFASVKYLDDILGFYRRLKQRAYIYQPNSICKGFAADEYLITGVNKTIYSVTETLTGFSSAIEKTIAGEQLNAYVGMIKHSNGYLYLNTGIQLIKSNSSFRNTGDSNYVAKTLYGLKQGFDDNLLVYNADEQSLIAIDSNLNYVDEFYIDSGNTPATCFYNTFDIAVNYVGMPRDIYSILSAHSLKFWAPFSEEGHSTGYSPNTANQGYSSANRLQLIGFSGYDQVSDGSLELDPISGNGIVTSSLTNNDVRITGDMTIIIWHKWDDVIGSSGFMLDCSGNNTHVPAEYMLYGILVSNTGSISIYYEDAGGTQVTVFGLIFPRDSQQHMLMFRRNSTTRNYELSIDGGVVNYGSYGADPTGGANAVLSIGSKQALNRVRGMYSDVYIFSDLLSDDEVSTIYHYGPSEPSWFDYTNWDSNSGLGNVVWKVA